MDKTNEPAGAAEAADAERVLIRERCAALEASATTKTEFLANVSQELRTPLALMLGPLEQLQRARGELHDPSVQRRVGENVSLVYRNAMRMQRLIDTMHDFSHLQSSEQDAAYEPTDLSEFTANVASNFRSLIEGAGLQFVVRCPELAEPVYIDHAMWEQVVLHLLANAFEHTFAGEIGVAVRIKNSAAELVVRDTGTGIPAEHLSRVCERFYRVPNARSRTDDGTGNGLALVEAIVRLHGGKIAFQSVVGSGTIATVAIPLGTAHLPTDRITAAGVAKRSVSPTRGVTSFVENMLRRLPAQPGPVGVQLETDKPGSRSAQSPHSPQQPRLTDQSRRTAPLEPRQGTLLADRRERILIADDNADMRQFLTGLLEGTYDVEAVSDGAVALASALERVPDLVLSDVMMPGLDGLGLLRALRADPRTRTVSVILVSGRAGEESRVEGLDVGADDYLEKPFTARELVARVNASLRLTRMRREVMEHEHRATVAEAANAAKTHFLTTMSHELRTPLNAIAGYVELMEMEIHGPVTEEQRRALGRIGHSGRHLLGLITDILDFSQLEAGQIQYQLRDVAIHDLLNGLGVLIEPQAKAKGIVYTYVSCANENLIVRTDPQRITQVLLNLLSNAIKFTDAGGKIQVACATSHTGEPTDVAWDQLEIRVTDTGRGIPTEQCASVFEPFVQLDRHLVRESQQGVGLGLAISRDLTRHLGGVLTVESIEGEGSTFSLMIPRWGPHTAQSPARKDFARGITPPGFQ